MTDKDRLMRLLCAVECKCEETRGNCPERRHGQCRSVQKLEMCQLGIIADHLLANGVIVLPCEVGSKVYAISEYKTKIHECRINSFEFTTHDSVAIMDYIVGNFVLQRQRGVYLSEFGKTVFLTKEEAEKALEAGKERDDGNV